MDSLTHTVLGACIGDLLGGKKLGKRAMFWGAVAANFPDIDVTLGLWMKIPDTTLAHRGFTHSFLFVLLFAPIAGYALQRLYKGWDYSFKQWTYFWGINLFIHSFIDALTAYGTGWFEPFSHYRVSFNTIFVADPFYTIALLVAAVALLIMKRTNLYRAAWAWWGIGISSAYMVYTLFNKYNVNQIATENFSKQGIAVVRYYTAPAPLNNFLWNVVAEDSTGYWIAYYSVFDKTNLVDFSYYRRNETALKPLEYRNDVRKLMRFSQGYYTVVDKDALLVFNDIRFGQIGGWYSGGAPFVFSYSLFKSESQNMIIQQGRYRASTGEALRSMIERIKGRN